MREENFQNFYEQKAKLLVNVMKMRDEDKKCIIKALNYASESHGNQRRKNGKVYIIHPIRVANSLIGEENAKVICAAILHDVVEDTEKTIEDIKNEFGEDIAKIVDSLTKREGESKESYIMRVSLNKKATRIKVKDAYDNLLDMEEIINKRLEDEEWAKKHIEYFSSIIERFGNEEEKKNAKEVKEKLESLIKK